MDDALCDVLRSIECRLLAIESRLTPQQAYSVEDVAELTGYAEWTLRQACNQGRIRGAYKASNRSWRIPHASLEDIKAKGLPSRDNLPKQVA